MVSRLPEMLREIVRSVVGAEPDLRLVAQAECDEDLFEAVSRTAPQVVILGAEMYAERRLVRRLLRLDPDLRILALEASGRRALLAELRLHLETLHELSPEILLSAIRGVRSAAGGSPRQGASAG